jgi:hypothetical protein
LAIPQAQASAPLSNYLVPAPGAADAVALVLGSISTDPSALGSPDRTVVTVDGRFRAGVLAGQHTKSEAEHIGVTARRARLERQRSEARRRLAEATADLEEATRQVAEHGEQLRAAKALRDRLPSYRALEKALDRTRYASEALAVAAELVDQRTAQARHAEETHAELVDKTRRLAANLGLIAQAEQLRAVERIVSEARHTLELCTHGIDNVVRSVRQCQKYAELWHRAQEDNATAEGQVLQASSDHDAVAARLAAIEQTVGAAYTEILANIQLKETDLRSTGVELETARSAQRRSVERRVNAERDRTERANEAAHQEHRVMAALPELRRALDVPGLLASVSAQTEWANLPVEETVNGLRRLSTAVLEHLLQPERREVSAEGVRQSLRQRRDSLGAGWDAEDHQPDEALPLMVEINGPEGRLPLAQASKLVHARRDELAALLSAEQDNALRNLLQGLVAREIAEKLHAASDLVRRMNKRLSSITTSHGIGVSIRWRLRDGLDEDRSEMVALLSKPPDLRTGDQETTLRLAISTQLDNARRENPDGPYAELVGTILDYRSWHEITLVLHRPGRPDERLSRRTALSEGEKKIVSYLPLFAAVAASCDSLAEAEPAAPRFLLLDDAFAKVSEDNHPKLFGLLVELDLDFIATSERLWGTHSTVPELAITEVVRDADLGVIVLEHSRWDGSRREQR